MRIHLASHNPASTAEHLAKRVRDERLRRNWKQATLAERAGISLPTLQRFEATGNTATLNLLRICHALGRLGDFDSLLKPPRAGSIAELEAQATPQRAKRKRGAM